MSLPIMYKWLLNEGGPKMLTEALKLYGTIETPGLGNSVTIISWADEVGGNVEDVYKADSIPWCGLFMAVVCKRADKEIVKSPLWALSWATFGEYTETPMLGDVLVFTRKGGGHVGIYVGEDATAYHVLGGNQDDRVSITRIAKSRLYTSRRPQWKIAAPPNRRRIILSSNGQLSTNEQ
jgi:uncharacterized protein (TIGR02594 family)